MNMEKLIRQIKSFNSILILCLIIFLMRLPPIYLVPISPFNSIFMSHNIARFLIIVAFAVALLTKYQHAKSSLDKKLCFLLGLFFLSQSLSVLYAQNISSFFTVYKDLVLSVLLFFSLFFIVEKDNQMMLIKTLLLATAISISFQTLTYFYPSFISDYLKVFFNERYWLFFRYQANRGRFFGEFFDEVTIPFLFYFLILQKETLKKIFVIMMVGVIFFITFVSSWRSKTILFLFGFIISLVIYFKQIKKYIIFLILGFFILTSVANFISLEKVGQNILDRFIFTDYQEVRITKSRYTYLIEALNMGLESPLFGVGLGNYYDNLSLSSKMENLSPGPGAHTEHKFIVIDDPHNIFISTFTATGLFGLFSLILLVLYLLFHDAIRFFTHEPDRLSRRTVQGFAPQAKSAHEDVTGLKPWSFTTNQLLLKASIISFWVLFTYALFNPWMYFAYLMFFMFLRGYVEKLSVLSKS